MILQPDESYRDQVTIKNATLSIAGHFACEVTTDIPSFHAITAHGELKVAGKVINFNLKALNSVIRLVLYVKII